jgi:hypothetical protein
MVKVTFSPSRIESNGVLVRRLVIIPTPSGVAMKPKPLSVMRLIVRLPTFVIL